MTGMTSQVMDKIPCRYAVARYVGDEIRDEPINIGVVLQSQKDYQSSYRFITRFDKIRTASEDSEFLRHILDKIYNEIKNTKNKEIENILSKYEGKIRFTELRGTLADDIDDEVNYLYGRYVSTEQQPLSKTSIKFHRYEIITLPIIRKNVWSFFKTNLAKYVRRNYIIQGKRSNFKYDFMFPDKKRVFHSISYDANDSLRKTKLFDWHVMDVLERNGLKQDNFGIIISEPSISNPRYDKIKEQFNDGIKILKSRDYNLIKYDEDGRWQKEIQVLV